MEYRGLHLDEFQADAFSAIDECRSIIISAPTGCGKTLVAEYAADIAMESGKRLIYTAPIKALSNQKYRDFKKRFGDEKVGIHTGDVSINPEAPLLIMTTEIFRNLILENSSRIANISYVVFDEIHFIDDEERGTVWEESIILAPKDIQFLCLSATVPNIRELADWMSIVRETDVKVIEENNRPVPLIQHLYSSLYGEINVQKVASKYKRKFSERKKYLRRRPASKRIVKDVIAKGQTPILYFCFNRRACEKNAHSHGYIRLLSTSEQANIRQLIDELIKKYNISEYDKLPNMRKLWENGIAYHHAGILPAAKEIVEQLFTSGLIKLLFCTETFALGVNMPASAVIFDELEKFNGVGFEYLTSRQFQQMAGRAGRRGMDKEGHVYSLIIPEATDPKEVKRLFTGKSERIRSRFCASYSTILNLYNQYGELVYDIFKKSLKNYKNGGFVDSRAYMKEEKQIRNRINFLKVAGFFEGTKLTPKGILAAKVNGYEIQTAELYYRRYLDSSTPQELCVILAALVTEEKKRREKSRLKFDYDGEKAIKKLRNMEIKFGIDNPISQMDFSLAEPVWAWANGCSLSELGMFGVPEGDLIRLFRMTIQLMRTLRLEIDDPVISDRLKEALELMNRDAVDAQAELEAKEK